jgi:spermidine synthase
MIEYRETMHDHYGQHFAISRIVYRETTAHQDLVIFETPLFGRVLALDGSIQTTTRDNHIYHEMFAHVPILAHGRVRRVLIIGGGDGGSLRETLKHGIEEAVLVDIDRAVIELCEQHMPELPDGAFTHPRARIVIDDGFRFVGETAERFEVIIVDSTDPPGPSEVLFTPEFYRRCKRCLTPGGVIATMAGTPFLQPELQAQSAASLGTAFADVGFYYSAVPSYTGGPLAMGFASDDPSLSRVDLETLRRRFAAAGVATRHYTPDIHRASFAQPAELARLLGRD